MSYPAASERVSQHLHDSSRLKMLVWQDETSYSMSRRHKGAVPERDIQRSRLVTHITKCEARDATNERSIAVTTA